MKEPVHPDEFVGASADDGEQVAEEDMRGENAVFGLIGTSALAGRVLTEQALKGRSAADLYDPSATLEAGCGQNAPQDIIETLHEQYWRALDNPQATLESTWLTQTAQPVGAGNGATGTADEWTDTVGGDPSAQGCSIESLVSGARILEDVFGPLSRDDALGAEVEPATEILRLFAPAEYLAAASRRSPALPAPLTRREHHALGIDSPIPVPDSTARQDAR